MRLIPAHAGKTWMSEGREAMRPAHPRSRGENVKVTLRANVADGSSPLTRGKQAVGPLGPGGGRLIPAHAGKTIYVDWATLSQAAHPRSRGENTTLPPAK